MTLTAVGISVSQITTIASQGQGIRHWHSALFPGATNPWVLRASERAEGYESSLISAMWAMSPRVNIIHERNHTRQNNFSTIFCWLHIASSDINVLVKCLVVPLFAGFLVGPFTQDLIYIVDNATYLFCQEVSKTGTIHDFRQSVCQLGSTMDPFHYDTFFDPIFDYQASNMVRYSWHCGMVVFCNKSKRLLQSTTA